MQEISESWQGGEKEMYIFEGKKLLSRWALKGLRSMADTMERGREAELHFTNFTAFQGVGKSE